MIWYTENFITLIVYKDFIAEGGGFLFLLGDGGGGFLFLLGGGGLRLLFGGGGRERGDLGGMEGGIPTKGDGNGDGEGGGENTKGGLDDGIDGGDVGIAASTELIQSL